MELCEPQPAGSSIRRLMEKAHAQNGRLLRAGIRWMVPVLLFAATALTTTVFGAQTAETFRHGGPLSSTFFGFGVGVPHGADSPLWTGLQYSVPVLAILLAHELGHLITARLSGVMATAPLFCPFPDLFGTLGATVLLRSPIVSRKNLLAIGASGPIAGFLVLFPILLVGVHLSHVVEGAQTSGPIGLGTPLLMRWVEQVYFPSVPAESILLHPTAVAAWLGLLATAINLIPAGQLDGGHILYATFGERVHRFVTFAVIAAMGLLGLLYPLWWVGGALLFAVRRHPLIHEEQPVSPGRVAVALTALGILAVSICLVPIQLR